MKRDNIWIHNAGKIYHVSWLGEKNVFSQEASRILGQLLGEFGTFPLGRLSLSVLFCFFNLFYFYLFIFGCVRSSLLCAGFSLVAASGGCSSLLCEGFSLWWLLLLRSTGSRRAGFSSCGSGALERRLSSCGARALLLRGMWDLPGPGLEPVSPALAGGFLTTAPPRKIRS